MPIDKYIVTRISLDARDKLAKLSKEKGISNAEIIDRMLGTSPEQLEFQEQQLGTTSRKSQWWVKDVSEYLKEKQLREDNKPPKAILESAILMTWKNTPTKVKNRKDIHNYIRDKMVRKDKVTEQSWSDYYPEWFKNHTDYMSTFEVAVDNRVKVMINRGLLKRVELKGSYELVRALSKDEWNIVTGVDNLPLQKGLVIKSFLPAKSKCDVCGEYKESMQGNKCGECLNIYNPIFSLTHLFPYI